ncbi:AraC family transcriptional regulator [Marinobacter sp. 1_MG-2023]|uniref:AraC family transcriptional regulator n=1 Tax=Marinobacter sp. 1_MG-2023 TaxID=3062627 RepID=UPI0026E38F76|nr:AraC family transcriptional regulator [Marinobacter sp. 1_MG-2023]MDO6825007.1 AraC family transcriptional regulator [Marinobacter sp. 1_MG-2023]
MANLIRATNLRGFERLIEQRGGDPLPLLEKYDIPPAQHRDDSSFLPFRNLADLLDDTAKTLNFPELGLKLAESQGLDILGPISVIARNSGNVGAAINNISRYLHLHSPALSISATHNSSSDEESIDFEFRIDHENTGGYHQQSYELSLSNSMQVMKLLCGDRFKPFSVHFIHAQVAETSIYQDVFGCQVLFNQSWCGMRWPAQTFHHPLSKADHQTFGLAEQYLSSQRPPNALSFSEDVTQLITTLLPTGQCRSDVVAGHFHMDKRTLQRHLAKEDTSFGKLLNAEKLKLAHMYLKEPNMKLSQIAGLLGYSEQSAFNRACRDWFGVSPLRYRKQAG